MHVMICQSSEGDDDDDVVLCFAVSVIRSFLRSSKIKKIRMQIQKKTRDMRHDVFLFLYFAVIQCCSLGDGIDV